ncbi:haloacid dehalogenase type II [Lutibacter sp. TH_r2]|uniref:haloacid dehalogenase type II n=1 Tax=Lutibacter sp. TH_r2 TaxID=3082083 RepID=UPI002954F7D7|nr:haloacid dehalogenase type II [Lutibacter sp. TH_r2]MDV7186539.1 haloacid dehalogenase type II [Lutibacter sp. TH_r2]
MVKFNFYIFIVITFTSALITAASAQNSVIENKNIDTISNINQSNNLTKPRVIIFDVNETLLNMAPLKKSVGEALNGREDLLPLWFSTMLHYSLVETVTENYHHFGEIGTAALIMVAETQGIAITYKNAKESIVTPLRSLPAHTDVLPGLKKLSESGFGIVSLTNSSAKGVETQFKNAGLTKYFDNRYTIETIQKYKPHLDTYAMVIKDLGLKPEEVLMVAAHAWDLAGAKKAGLQTAFIKRPGKVLYPNVEKPDYVVKDLTELVKIFQEKGYFKIDY